MIKVIQDIPAVGDFESQGKRIYNKMYILEESDVDYSDLPEITDDDTGRTMAALTSSQQPPDGKSFHSRNTLSEPHRKAARVISPLQ